MPRPLPSTVARAAARCHALQLEHRRIGGQHVARAAGRELGRPVERAGDVGHDLDRRLVDARVLQPQRRLGCPRPRGDDMAQARGDELPVDIPHP